MLRHTLVAGGIAMLAATGPTLAQDQDRPEPPATSDRGEPAGGEERRGPPDDPRRGEERRVGHDGPRNPMAMGEAMTGFVLDFGDDRSLRVSCGDEPIGPCMEAVRPLIDQIPALTND